MVQTLKILFTKALKTRYQNFGVEAVCSVCHKPIEINEYVIRRGHEPRWLCGYHRRNRSNIRIFHPECWNSLFFDEKEGKRCEK